MARQKQDAWGRELHSLGLRSAAASIASSQASQRFGVREHKKEARAHSKAARAHMEAAQRYASVGMQAEAQAHRERAHAHTQHAADTRREALHRGAKGGSYYISPGGKKVYVKGR